MSKRNLKKSAEEEFGRWIAEGRVDRDDQYGIAPDLNTLAAHEPVDQPQAVARDIMDEAFSHLQGQRAEVYNLVMRCGLSFSQCAAYLGISKAYVQKHVTLAVQFVTDYCKEAIARGRV